MKWKVECQAKVRNLMSCATQCPTTLYLKYKEKFTKGIWGYILKLNHIKGGGGCNTRTKGWPNTNLIRKGDGGG